jgi:hypothetical protein
MRTRIALVAIVPIALITVSLLTLAATAQPARAAIRPLQVTTTQRSPHLTSIVRPKPPSPTAAPTVPNLSMASALLAGQVIGHKEVAPVVPPPTPVVTDTVTPGERAAWDRVAMCEEGGNWRANGPRFSGGLGITRANWSIYGGLRYAPVAAMATPDQQIMVAQRIQGHAPDQRGCSSW